MRRKTVSGTLLSLLLIGALALAFNIQQVKASGTIYIRADGSIDPPTANITTVDNITYTFIGNINEPIVVERDDIVVEGAGYTLQGSELEIGIKMNRRSNVTIENMEIKSCMHAVGIWLGYGSSYNTISGNNITNNGGGIHLYDHSDYNTISGNNITNNEYGILLTDSSNNTLRSNDVSNNECNFGIEESLLLSHYIHDIDVSNTVDGKPIYYWINRQDMAVPLDAGYVALVNCTNITVENLNLTNNGQGVLLVYTTNSTITKNNITINYGAGIYLYMSSNNVILGNNVANNLYGIACMDYCSNNTITRNTISASDLWEIVMERSSNNTVYHNNLMARAPPQVHACMHVQRTTLSLSQTSFSSVERY